MDYKLAREIYGSPWMMDSLSMQKFAGILKDFRNGVKYEHQGEKDNDTSYFEVKSETMIFDSARTWKELDDKNDYIAVTEINGAITKSGGGSHNGTVSIARNMQLAENRKNVLGHILVIDSGGGSANAVHYLTDQIEKLEKPVISYIDGMAASAAYYIASYSDYIIASNNNDIIGSIGTMVEMQGFKKIDEDKSTGETVVRVYADGSTMKNKTYENAINDLDFKLIKEKMLNPLNVKFINDVKSQRNMVTEEQLTGDTFRAEHVVGTMIDKVGTLEDAVNLIKNKTKTEIMTKSEFKTQFPGAYNEIISEGIAQERDRVNAILTYADVDLEASKKLVESGDNPSQKFYAEMNRKSLAKSTLQNAENTIDEVTTPVEEVQDVKDANYEQNLKEVLEAAGIVAA